MRIAALYDIHGNLPALEAVLADVSRAGVDRIVVGGDVYPGPMAEETLACLLAYDLPTTFILGNGDRETLAFARGDAAPRVPESYLPAMRWVAERLTDDHQEQIARWPTTARLDVEGLGEVLFCHATPRDDNEIFTKQTPVEPLIPIFEAAGVPTVVCGHTHMTFDRKVGNVRVLNAGSVGMPFGEPGAWWLRLGPDVELRRTAYDLESAADRIRSTDYPGAAAFAEHNVLEPPSEAEMLERFAKAEIA